MSPRRAVELFAVHPHGCGEHRSSGAAFMREGGSSPRVWGAPAALVLSLAAGRFIPTGVGSTPHAVRSVPSDSVHPHGCGEHSLTRASSRMCPGSSPRVWGAPPRVYTHVPGRRFIPTGVGSTRAGRPATCASSVHPHGCGEHGDDSLVGLRPDGSSPRVWGAHEGRAAAARLPRFIPTGVGSTRCGSGRRRGSTVHPHGCGEHEALDVKSAVGGGSSPRVWGALGVAGGLVAGLRFIPTGVGSTRCPRGPRHGSPVHPHGCGEHVLLRAAIAPPAGSSPRVWGARRLLLRFDLRGRFIPTGVGSTRWSCRRRSRSAVHPHGCGEHAVGRPARRQ